MSYLPILVLGFIILAIGSLTWLYGMTNQNDTLKMRGAIASFTSWFILFLCIISREGGFSSALSLLFVLAQLLMWGGQIAKIGAMHGRSKTVVSRRRYQSSQKKIN
jgi:hypothetical protein